MLALVRVFLPVIFAASCAAGATAPYQVARVQSPPRKADRTPAQQKIDSRLLDEIHRMRAKGVRSVPSPRDVRVDRSGRALVDVRALVTASLKARIRKVGGTIVSTAPEYRSIVAWIPLAKLEPLAAEPDVLSITPKAEPGRRE